MMTTIMSSIHSTIAYQTNKRLFVLCLFGLYPAATYTASPGERVVLTFNKQHNDTCWHTEYINNRKTPKKEEHPITLITSDGLVRSGVLSKAQHPKGCVVLAHPAAYDKNFMVPYDEELFEDYHTIRFDFRRHGENIRDQYTTMGKKEACEVRSAVHFLREHEETKHLPIFGFGVSMGAAALVEAESQTPLFDGLILQSMFDSLGNQFKRLSRFFQLFPFMIFRHPTRLFARTRHRWDLCKVKPARALRTITTPVCLIHAQNDPFIPFTNFKRLCKAGKQCVRHTWTPKIGKHTALLKENGECYKKTCQKFLQTLYEGSAT